MLLLVGSRGEFGFIAETDESRYVTYNTEGRI